MLRLLQNRSVKIITGLCTFFLVFFLSGKINAQTLITFDPSSVGSSFPASPWTIFTIDPHYTCTTTGLVRGSSIAASGTSAGGCYGGSGGWVIGAGSEATSFYFGISATCGTTSISQISGRTRRSTSGPTSVNIYYSLDGGTTYVFIGNWATSATSSPGTAGATSLSSITALQNIPAGTNIKFKFTPQQGSGGSGGNWYFSGGAGALVLTGTFTSLTAPAITTDPSTVSIASGASTSFTISGVSGAASYQWQRNTSGIVGGTWVNITSAGLDGGSIYSGYTTTSTAATNTLTLTGVTASLNGYGYRCVVTNCAGNTTSGAAILNVSSGACSGIPAAGTPIPGTASFCGSGSTTLNLTGGSTGTGLTYQWSSSLTGTPPGTDISGATLSSYTTPALSATTYYWCTTTCAASSLSNISATGTVTINPTPSIIVTPPGGSYCSGTSGLNMTASGASTYTWSPSTGLSATTGSSVTASSTSAVTYTVTGTSSAGCTATNTAAVNYYTTPPTPIITPSSLSACVGGTTNVLSASAGVSGPSVISSGTINMTMSGVGLTTETPTLAVSGIPAGATITGISIALDCSFAGSYQNSYIFNLKAPNGKIINLIQGDGCAAPCTGAYTGTVISSGGTSAVSTGATPFTGTFSPDANAGALPSGPYVQNTALLSDLWSGSGPNGTWTLATYHNYSGSDPNGTLISWSITINYTFAPPITWSPITDLYTDAAGTTSYTGTATNTVYENPVTPSITTYTVTANNGGCSSTATITATVNSLPSAGTITGVATVCESFTTTLTDAASDGTWSSDATGIASVDPSTGEVTGVAEGTATISYNVTTSCGTDVATTIVTVNPLPPIPTTISGTTTLCELSTTLLSDAVAGGDWNSDATSIATIDATGLVTGVAAGTTTISYSFTNSCATTLKTTIVTVNPLPVAGTITGPATVCVLATTSLTDAATGGDWTSDAAGIAAVDATGVVTGVAAGTATISYSVTNSCGTDITTIVVTVNSLPAAGSITGTTTVCVLANTALTDAATDGVWNSADAGIAAVDAAGIVTGVAAGTATISYSVTNSCGTDVTTTVVTTNPLPFAETITGTSTVCVLATTPLTDATAGGIWGSADAGTASVDASGVVTGVVAGTTTISYSVTNTCGTDVATTIVTVNPLPAAGSITGITTVCMLTTTTLTDATVGGVWNSAGSGIASVDATGVVTGVAAGTTTISYGVTNSCGTDVTTIIVTVNPLPIAGTITGTSTACALATTSLTDAATGGVWTSADAGTASVDASGVVTSVAAGTTTISYSVTNTCGTDVATTVITVNPLPNAGSITGTATVCILATTSLTDASAGGVWNSSDAGTASVDASGTVTGVVTGTAIISYSVTNGCGTDITTVMVTVNPLPTAGTITGIATVCALSTTSLTDAAPGGVWTSDATSIATVGTSGIVTGVAAGTATISYDVTNSCGTDVATQIVTVNALPVTPVSITGTSIVCVLATTSLSDVTAGGTWTSDATGIATVDPSGIVTGVAEGTATISYNITNSCGTNTTTTIVTVNPLPTAGTITGTATVCALSTIALTDVTSGGTWTSDATSIATVGTSGIVTGVAEGTTTISYNVTNSCGTEVTTKIVTINPLPATPTSIAGTATVCVLATTSLSDGASGGTWASDATGIATVDVSGIVTGTAAGTATISYNITNTCGTNTTTTIVTVNPLSDAGTITGTATVCVLSTTSLTDVTPGGTWASDATGIATVGTSGVVTGVYAGTATISYSVTNSCGTATATNIVTVNPLPATPSSITGTAIVCVLATTSLSDITAGGTWASDATGIATVGTSGIVTGIATGTATISYNITNSCGTNTTTIIVTANPLPDAGAITGTATACVVSTTSLTDAISGGAWTSDATSIAVVGTSGIVTGVGAGTATISYSITNGCGTATATNIVTVNPLPEIPTSITGTTSVCGLATTSLSDVTPGGIWSSDATSIAIVSSAGTVSGIATGTAVISYTVSNSCGTNATTAIVTVNPLPSAGTITGTATMCLLATTSLSDATSGGTWSSDATSIATIGTSGIVTGVAAGTAVISYSVTNGCGTDVATIIATVIETPATPLPITGAATVCIFSTTSLSNATTGGVWSSSNIGIASVGASGIIAGISAGTTTISYTVTNSCGMAYVTTIATVIPAPAAGTITGTTTVCALSVISLSDIAIGGEWSSDATGIATVGSAGSVTGVLAGTATISYTIINGCGTSTATTIVTVNPLPDAGTITGIATVCALSTTALTDAATGGIWSSTATVTGTVGTSGIVAGIAAGTTTISYTVTNSCGIAVASSIVTVNPLPVAGTVTGPSILCALSTISLGDIAPGGSWSSDATSIAVAGSAGDVTGVSAGVATISYTVINSCGTATATMMVTVNPLPVAGIITGITVVCAGSTTPLTDATSGGIWSSSDIGIATVGTAGITTGVAAGTATISYSVTNSCGMDAAVITVTVNPLADAGTITGATGMCMFSGVTLVETAPDGLWSSDAPGIASVDAGGNVMGVSAGTATISYSVSNSCGTQAATVVVTVDVAPAVPSAIVGTTTVCASSTTTLADAVPGGVWSSGALSIATVDVTGMVTGTVAGTATISYSITNSCGSNTTTTIITVNPLPAPVIVTTDLTLSTTISYTTYQWLQDGSVITGATNATYLVTDSATYSVTVTDGNGCAATSAGEPVALGVYNINNANAISIYPNPASYMLTISAPEKINVSILSIDGKNLIDQKDAKSINVSNLAPGLYMIRVYNEQNDLIKMLKFTKE